MEIDKRVSDYMDEIGIKYIKNANEFIGGLAYRTDRNYAKQVADELNARAGGGGSGQDFYSLKNSNSLAGSLYISSAFDGGVFRHIGNIIAENPELFDGKILDIGCDCGMAGCFIAKTYPDCTVVSIDKNEKAVERAKELAAKLSLSNITFEVCDALKGLPKNEFDTVVSFRTLLDVCSLSTKSLPFFGAREKREKQYENAFSSYAHEIFDALKENGVFLSIERYTADYGWLGWMQALEKSGLTIITDKSEAMKATDISSVKDYSVTFAEKSNSGEKNSYSAYDFVMSNTFKSGAGCIGAQAEYAAYRDCNELLKSAIVYNKNQKPVHQYAVILAEKEKIALYEAHGNSKKIKYSNLKKKDSIIQDVENALKTIDGTVYTIEKEF